jgi:hypothetical protein
MGGFSVQCDCGKWFTGAQGYYQHCKDKGCIWDGKRVGPKPMSRIPNECSRCGYDYPEDVGLSRVSGTLSTRGPVCGICALEISNAAMGIKRTSFNGEMAEEYRLAALEARNNGTAKPPKEEIF